MPAREGFRANLPAGGIKAALIGGNTIGASIREATPRSDGYRHLDTPRLIERLQELNTNTYFYGVWDSATDWDDLRLEFLPAAQEIGLKVIPYLVPPSETDLNGRASRPYLMDYVAWARAHAELSLEYPNLIGWSIDDFEFDMNAKLFTHEYMTQMRETQDAINPDLGFLTCAYWGAATSPEFLDKYGPFIDGIVYPYLDGHNHNTQVTSTVKSDLDAIREVAEPRGIETILLVYAGRFLTSQLRPTETYAAECVRAGVEHAAEGKIAGVVAYGTQVDGAPTPNSENLAMYGSGRLSLAAPYHSVAKAGTYAEGWQTVAVDPDSPRYELSFWHYRLFTSNVPAPGDYVFRVLVDDEEVWASDVRGEPWALWIQGKGLQGPVDITPYLKGKTSARLAFRLTAERDVSSRYVDVGIDHLEAIGFTIADPGFEEEGAWQYVRGGDGPILACVDHFVPDRPERIFRAVGEEFGR